MRCPCDVTFVPAANGFLYLAVVLDAWSRKIVGWAMATYPRAELVVDALEMAVGQRRPGDVIHHSDQESQGELNWLSQHPGGRCDSQTEAELGLGGTGVVVVARPSAGGGTARAAAVLGGDHGRLVQ